MKVCVYLSYIGLGANLLHLSYVHQLSEKFGPLSIITLCKNLGEALEDDPNIKEVIVFKKDFNKNKNIFKFGNELKKYNFEKIFIYYSSPRIVYASKLAGIKDIYHYPYLIFFHKFRKKNLNLIQEAKALTCKILRLDSCKTFTKIYVNKEKRNKVISNFNKSKCNIIIGAGSSGPSTKWGEDNYAKLINKLNEKNNFNFFMLCGPEEKKLAKEIIKKSNANNIFDLSNLSISEVMPFLVNADMYVGNDTFGSHVCSQSGKPSIVILLDSPKTYTDYTPNHIRIIPKGYDINKISHGSRINPNLISVEQVYKKIYEYI